MFFGSMFTLFSVLSILCKAQMKKHVLSNKNYAKCMQINESNVSYTDR